MKNTRWLLLLLACFLLVTACGPELADTTPPDLTKFGFNRELNPDLKSTAVITLLAGLRVLSPQAAAAVGIIQGVGGCLVSSKVAQWALYTDPKNKLTVGFLMKASKNGLTDPGTLVKCLSQKLPSGPSAADFQTCAAAGQYVDVPTKDTVYEVYVADEAALCTALRGTLPAKFDRLGQ